MLRDLDAGDGRVDGVVVGAGLFLSIASNLWVKGIDMGRAAAQPDEDAGVRFAFRYVAAP